MSKKSMRVRRSLTRQFKRDAVAKVVLPGAGVGGEVDRGIVGAESETVALGAPLFSNSVDGRIRGLDVVIAL